MLPCNQCVQQGLARDDYHLVTAQSGVPVARSQLIIAIEAGHMQFTLTKTSLIRPLPLEVSCILHITIIKEKSLLCLASSPYRESGLQTHSRNWSGKGHCHTCLLAGKRIVGHQEHDSGPRVSLQQMKGVLQRHLSLTASCGHDHHQVLSSC